jgi:hypothetical protein
MRLKGYEARPLSSWPGRWRVLAGSEWTVAAVVLLFYGAWLAVQVPRSHDGRDFILLGRTFAQRHVAGSAIRVGPPYLNEFGYDGQFYYYIALDPVHARFYIDDPSYRYTRILYPIMARLLAFGRPALVPYTLIAVNWLALGFGTLLLAAWLRRRACSPWFALLFGLYPGLLVSLQRDLTEPLSYALVALAIYLLDVGGRWRIVWAGSSFALAALTREVSAVFAVVYGLAELVGGSRATPWYARLVRNWRRAVLLLALALMPLTLYKVFLRHWLGSAGVPSTVQPVLVPFQGLVSPWAGIGTTVEQLVEVILPALICLAVACRTLWIRSWGAEVWALLANVVLFVVLLNATSYGAIEASGRIAASVVLAALLCLPRFDRVVGNRRWLWASGLLWLSLLPFTLLGPRSYHVLHVVYLAALHLLRALAHHP